MVHYIRFLQTPQASQSKKTVKVTFLVTITTDLGDLFFPLDTVLVARVVEAPRPNVLLAEKEFQWHIGCRALKITLEAIPSSKQPLRVNVTTRATTASISSLSVPRILDAWSAPFVQTDRDRAPSLVERRLELTDNIVIHIWEETGNSIARHIWDAALGCLICFQDVLSKPNTSISLPTLQNLLRQKRFKKSLLVLELGAGCGIVGIALAQITPNCKVWLTDLAEAQEILQRNISIASLSPGSSLDRKILDWGSASLHDSFVTDTDLVIVSDCTYNADSSPDLVRVLVEITKHSPEVKILVAMKRRHESETIFFDLMRGNDFHALESSSITLPNSESEQDMVAPVTELYLYQRIKKE